MTRVADGHRIAKRFYGPNEILCRHYGDKLVWPEAYLCKKEESTQGTVSDLGFYQISMASRENPASEKIYGFAQPFTSTLGLNGFTVMRSGSYALNARGALRFLSGALDPGVIQALRVVKFQFGTEGQITGASTIYETAVQSVVRGGAYVSFNVDNWAATLAYGDVVAYVWTTWNSYLREKDAYFNLIFTG